MKKRQPLPREKLGLAWASILAPLGLGFVFSLLLAYQAFDAGYEHRGTASAAVRDHAQFAAFLIGTTVDRRMREALLYGFYPVDLALGREGGAPPPPEVLRTEPEVSRCGSGLPAKERHFFRYDPQTGEALVDGPDPAALAGWLRSGFEPIEEAETGSPAFRHAVAQLSGERRLIAYRRWGPEHGRVVYGFESCWRTGGEDVFRGAMAATQAFSPTLVGETPNDSLFTLSARDGDGVLVHGEWWTRPEPASYGDGSFYGTASLEPTAAYGGLQLRVTLLPRVAERLVEGGLPASRLPLALGLLSLNGVLMWIGVRQLRRSHELVSLRARFVRNVSHELRTPLQQILLFTDLLRSGRLPDAEKRTQAIDIMHAETRRLIELVRNLLRFSAGAEEELRIRDIDLALTVRETVEMFRPLAAARQASIEIEEDGHPRALADEGALKRVILNLLDNAVKYGPRGQSIRVGIGSDGAWAVVSVTDEGPGIPPGEYDRIWEAFHRLECEETSATAGSGIGLSIVRRLVGAMDGEVEVTNAEVEPVDGRVGPLNGQAEAPSRRVEGRDGAVAGACFVVRLPIPGGPA